MMMVSAVGARALPSRNPVMEMAPVGRRHILRLDAERFDRLVLLTDSALVDEATVGLTEPAQGPTLPLSALPRRTRRRIP